jgi:hypothetical protein
MHHGQQKNHCANANRNGDQAAELQTSALFLHGDSMLLPQVLHCGSAARFRRFGNLFQQIILVVELAFPGSRASPGCHTKESEKCNAANAQPYKYGYAGVHGNAPLKNCLR